MLSMVLGRCDAAQIPAPSYIIATGRGLAAVWLHEPVPRSALPRWQAIQAGIHERMRGLGADAGARDAARVLRLVGTRHTGAGRPVRCIYPLVGEPMQYGFGELAEWILPYPTQRAADRERARRRGRPGGIRLAATDGRPTSRGPWALWANRLDDLQDLRRMRWFGPLPPGVRDPWTFCGAVALSWMVPAGAILRREVLELAREALGGAWTERQIETDMGAVLRRAADAAAGLGVEWPPGSGVMVDPRYRMRDETIIATLGITDEELAALSPSGQLGRAGLVVRQAARGRRSGESRRAAVANRDREIVCLRDEEGLSPGAIGARLAISRGAVLKALARLENPARTGGDPEPCIGA